MSFQTIVFALTGWFIAAGITAVAIGAVLRFDDQSFMCRFADKRDQQRMVDVIAAQELRGLEEDAEVQRLDAVWDLPAFGGWRSS